MGGLEAGGGGGGWRGKAIILLPSPAVAGRATGSPASPRTRATTAREREIFLGRTQVRGLDGRVGLHAGGVAVGDDGAVVEDAHVVADVHHETHVVLDQQARRCPGGRGPRGPDPSSTVSSWFNPELGSSTRSTDGPVASARPSSTRRARPVGSRSVGSSATCDNPTWARMMSASVRELAPVGRRRLVSAAIWTFSRAVRVPKSSRRWKVRAMPEPGPLMGRDPGDVDTAEAHPALRRVAEDR